MLSRRVIPFVKPVNSYASGTESPRMVVQVGRDGELLRLRARVVSSAGLTVLSISPDQVVAEVRKSRGTLIWVFCHTLEFYELALLALAIRQSRPGDRLLRLAGLNDTEQPSGLFDELLEPVEGVDDLLRVVSQLTKSPRGQEAGWETELI